MRCCFVRRCPGRAVEGGQWYPMAAYTSVRRRTGTVDISKAANHRESAFLAPGRHDRSTIRLEVYFFLATRANNIAGQWAINDRLKGLPPVLYDCLFRCGPLAKHLECLQIRTVRRRSTARKSVPSPGAHKTQEALELAPTATSWRVQGRPEPPTGTRGRSRVRCTSRTRQPKQISFFHRLATNNTEM